MNINLLKEKSLQIRRTILKAALSAGKGHIPPCYSWTDIASVLFYGNILNISRQQNTAPPVAIENDEIKLVEFDLEQLPRRKRDQ